RFAVLARVFFRIALPRRSPGGSNPKSPILSHASLSRSDPGSRTTDPGGEGHLTTDPDGEEHLDCSGHVVCSPHSYDLFRASKGRLSPYIGPPTDIHRRRRACLEKCA